MDELTKRNFHAVQQALEQMKAKQDKEREEREALMKRITMLETRFNEMHQTVAFLRVSRFGAGPTAGDN